jgi:hypothetical protein
MKNQPLTEDNYCRVARAIIDKHGCTYNEAVAILESLHLNLVCSEEIATSVSMQAALLTAVNTGKRSFLGGVSVSLPASVPNLLPWPTPGTLNDIVREVGGILEGPIESPQAHTLYFGKPTDPAADSLRIVCSGWRGGVEPAPHDVTLPSEPDFATGGILAGALGVAKGFVRLAGLSSRFVTEPEGLSLWRPDLHWLDVQSCGPELEMLPQNLWLLGLGHLGQAYVWNLGLLPYEWPAARVFLQDFDRVIDANWTAGLLCNQDSPGKFKTRLCVQWLEDRKFETRIVERAFDEMTRRAGDEPFIALCGFDNIEARQLLEDAGFDLVIECGLGGSAANFDDILFHTFPKASMTPRQIWGNGGGGGAEQAPEAFAKALGDVEGDCGILANTLAGKAISSSFVGAYAGALCIGELLRGLHGGARCEFIKAHLRSDDAPRAVALEEAYQNRFARSGYLAAARDIAMTAIS